jgi:hypothetical protein
LREALLAFFLPMERDSRRPLGQEPSQGRGQATIQALRQRHDLVLAEWGQGSDPGPARSAADREHQELSYPGGVVHGSNASHIPPDGLVYLQPDDDGIGAIQD